MKTRMIGLLVAVQISQISATSEYIRSWTPEHARRVSVSFSTGQPLLTRSDSKRLDRTPLDQIIEESRKGYCANHPPEGKGPEEPREGNKLCVCGQTWIQPRGSITVMYESDMEKLTASFRLVDKVISGISTRYDLVKHSVDSALESFPSKYEEESLLKDIQVQTQRKILKQYVHKNAKELVRFFIAFDIKPKEKERKSLAKRIFGGFKKTIKIGLKVVRIVAAMMEFNVTGAFDGMGEMLDVCTEFKDHAADIKDVLKDFKDEAKKVKGFITNEKLQADMKTMKKYLEDLDQYTDFMQKHHSAQQTKHIQLTPAQSEACDSLRNNVYLGYQDSLSMLCQETKYRQEFKADMEKMEADMKKKEAHMKKIEADMHIMQTKLETVRENAAKALAKIEHAEQIKRDINLARLPITCAESHGRMGIQSRLDSKAGYQRLRRRRLSLIGRLDAAIKTTN